MAATPQWIGRYRVHDVIGTGGFATVFRARDEHLNVDVAIKVLAENHSLDPEVRQRFIEEGRRLRRVRSPHVVGVHDLGDTERAQPYLVLDWADQGDLATRVADARKRGHPPGPDDVGRVAGALAAALEVLHRHHLVHRDLAPGNLLLCSTGHHTSAVDRARVTRAFGQAPPAGVVSPSWVSATVPLIAPDEQLMLADLGLSKDLAVASGLTLAAGTSGFAPPEQRTPGNSVDHRADIWAASALIFWLATDRSPDDDGRWQRSLRSLPWPPELARVLARGMAKRPDRRHQDINEWRTELEAALHPRPPAPNPRPPRRTSRPIRWRIVLPLLLGLTLLAGGAIGAAVRGVRSNGPDVRVDQLDDGRQHMIVEDHGIAITLIGATTAAIGEPLRLEATVDGTDTWQWVGPDGALFQGEDAIELTPQSEGRSTVRLQAFDERGRSVVATHRLEVSDRGP
jgi:serine/threonine protein kinase